MSDAHVSARYDHTQGEPPVGNLNNLVRYAGYDVLSGFLVFLIALPLCLGIAMASGFPAIAGVFAAIIGGVLCPLISNSELTIKGPAAGLIVIALGSVTELGQGDPMRGYRLTLAVGCAAGVIQVLFGVLRAGVLGEFFPTSAVHGMLAAIGVIIGAKQLHTVFGVKPSGTTPLELLSEVPSTIAHMNPEIAIIGLGSLLLLFAWPMIPSRALRSLPAPVVVLALSILAGAAFDLDHEHLYTFGGAQYHLGPTFLVKVPDRLFDAVTLPDWSALTTATGIKYVIMFALVGSLESLLSAKAIDLLDPYQRRTNMDRDLVAVGCANVLSSCVGGLPMISEIVRSSANINSGARTRFANMFHGLFLLGFVALFPHMIGRIPYAALAAMLVYTGYRLASPSEFVSTFKIGTDQLIIFCATLLMTLQTDLLIGIGSGIAVKFLMHLRNGTAPRALFHADLAVEEDAQVRCRVRVRRAAIFSNWIDFKKRLDQLGPDRDVVLDLSDTHLVDHTVMCKLSELEREFSLRGRTLTVVGLDGHLRVSEHPFAARKKAVTA